MPSLSVRNLSETTFARLRRRAASNNRSMEAEARMLLDRAVSETSVEALPEQPPQNRRDLAEWLRQRSLARTGGRILPDSAPLIRRDRDAR